MLVIRGDVLVAGALVALLLICLLVQLVMRFDAARWLQARRLSASGRTQEPNLYDRLPRVRRRRRGSSRSARRIS